MRSRGSVFAKFQKTSDSHGAAASEERSGRRARNRDRVAVPADRCRHGGQSGPRALRRGTLCLGRPGLDACPTEQITQGWLRR